MQNEQYLSEEKYQKNAKSLKKLGKIFLIVGGVVLALGIILTILGFVNFGDTASKSLSLVEDNELSISDVSTTASNVFGNFVLFVIGGFADTVGFGLLIAGGIILIIAHRREIKAFEIQQVMPVAQEGIDKMSPTIGNAAKEIAKGIKEGINEADKEE